MKKTLPTFLSVLALTALLIVGCTAFDVSDAAVLITLPFSLIGNMLRSLSLSGSAGNIVSVVLYVLICLLPLIPCIKGKLKAEHLLLLLCSGMMFYTVYYTVNPSLRPVAMQSTAGSLTLCGTVYSTLLSYMIIRFLRRCTENKSDSIYRILRGFVWVVIAGIAISTASEFTSCLAVAEKVRAANTMPETDFMPTYVFLFLSFALTSIENGLITFILLLASALLCELEADPYSDGCCTACEKIFAWCRNAVVIISAANVIFNAVQILLSARLLTVNVQFRLPVTGLAVAFAFMALSRLLNKGRKIKNTNDLFI